MHLKEFLSLEEMCTTVIPTEMDTALWVPSNGAVDMVLEESAQENSWTNEAHTQNLCVGENCCKEIASETVFLSWKEGESTKPWC